MEKSLIILKQGRRRPLWKRLSWHGTNYIKTFFVVNDALEPGARAQCVKTFYARNLQMFVIVFVTGKPFQPIYMFESKARSLP